MISSLHICDVLKKTNFIRVLCWGMIMAESVVLVSICKQFEIKFLIFFKNFYKTTKNPLTLSGE